MSPNKPPEVNYARNLSAVSDSIHELQSDVHKLAEQQARIHRMMSGQQHDQHQHRMQPPQQGNPMDPQPFYMANDSPHNYGSPPPPPQQATTPQRRTWGQPQPIHFAHQPPYGGPPAPPSWQNQRQQPWMYGGYGAPPPPPHFDPYHQSPSAYGGYSGGYEQYRSPPHYPSPYGPYGGGGGGGGGGAPAPPFGGHGYASPTSPSTAPFRLHESSKVGAAAAKSPIAAFLARRASEGPSGTPSPAPASPQPSGPISPRSSITRGALAESSTLSPQPQPQPSATKLHTSVPAPEEDDMAPQDISFIESEGDKADKEDSNEESPKDEADAATSKEALKRLPERLSQLNISSGSKTYRVHHGSSPEKETSPSPTRSARPSISSTFKQARRSSGEGENPPSVILICKRLLKNADGDRFPLTCCSISNPSRPGSGPPSLRSPVPARTEEEEETLAAMRTERLKDDKDAASGFVISFEDDAPKRSKPVLPQRRPSNARRSSSGSGVYSGPTSFSRKENLPPEVMICIVSATRD